MTFQEYRTGRGSAPKNAAFPEFDCLLRTETLTARMLRYLRRILLIGPA
jgi:hypothetical protein